MSSQLARPARAVARPLHLLISVLLLGWLFIPLIPLLLWSGASRWSGVSRLPQDFGLRGWREALNSGAVPALIRSGVLGVTVAVIATPLGVAAGRALGWRLVRRPVLPTVVLLGPVVLAPYAIAMGFDVVTLRLGVPGEVAVVVALSVFALPYTTFTMRATYLGLDPALEEQARVLGASPRQALRHVTLPAAGAGLATAVGLAFLVGWSDYAVTLLIGGGQIVTMPMLIGAAAAGSGNNSLTSALAVAASLPPLLALAVFAYVVPRRTAASR